MCIFVTKLDQLTRGEIELGHIPRGNRFVLFKTSFTNIPGNINPPDTEIVTRNFDFVEFSRYTHASLL